MGLRPLKGLWRHIQPQKKRYIILYIILVIINAFTEVFSIGMLIPFLAAITDPSMIFNHELGGNFIEWAEISEPQKILLPITIIFVSTIILAGCFRLLVLWGGYGCQIQ